MDQGTTADVADAADDDTGTADGDTGIFGFGRHPSEEIAPPRPRGFLRRHRVLVALFLLTALLLGTLGGWLVTLDHKLGQIPRFDAALDTFPRAPRVPGEAVNLLLVGVDNPDAAGTLDDALAADEWQPGVFRSDTMIVLHLSADRRSAQLISLPRDSWVSIDGWGDAKLNAAFSYGGPALLARTVEQVTGLYIDHVAVVDLEGLGAITDTVGGVDVQIPETVTDTYRDQTWTAGTHHLDGEQALLYVRQRAGLAGGDFDRIQRQQNLLRAMLATVVSQDTLTSPTTITGLVGDVASHTAVDDTLTNGVLRSLALSCRNLRESDVSFATAPVLGLDRVDGQSVVRLDLARTQELFDAVGHDEYAAWTADHPVEELPAPDQVD